MTESRNQSSLGALLFARLQLAAPQGRTFLVTSARGEDVESLAEQLASHAQLCGRKTRLLVPETATPPSVEGVDIVGVSGPACSEREKARRLLAGEDYVVAAWRDLLGSAEATILAASVDGVVVVARRARTAQADLQDVRLELERFGGRLAAAVLLD